MPLFDLHRVWFVVLGYRMSGLEFLVTASNVLAVWLMTRKNVWTWPVGLAATALFGLLSFEQRMYPDTLEQVYYFATNCWGWWLWTRGAGEGPKSPLHPTYNRAGVNVLLAVVIAAATAAFGFVNAHVHIWWPAVFAHPASFAYLDSFATAMSFVAQMLAAYMKMENWTLWMLVNAISAWMYWQRGVAFVSLLFVGFFLLAVKGWLNWRADAKAAAAASAPSL